MADDSGGVFGGNGSVSWVVDVGNVREAKHETKPGGRHLQAGINEVRKGMRFTIVIKLPRDSEEKAAFRVALRAAAGSKDRRVTFTLPIEDKRKDQIRISWKSEARKRRGSRRR